MASKTKADAMRAMRTAQKDKRTEADVALDSAVEKVAEAMEAKHTPGRWRSKLVYGDPHKYAVMGPPHADGGDFAPLARFASKADANLSAAAPDLLAVCKAALARYRTQFGKSCGGPTGAERDALAAAILKATRP